MKYVVTTTTLIIFLLTAPYFIASSQSSIYHAIPDSNVYWTVASFELTWPGPMPVYYNYTTRADGDTIINNISYTKLYEDGYYYAIGPNTYYSNLYQGAYRQDTVNKKVFYIEPLSSTEVLLHDFDLALGDTLPQSYTNLSNAVIGVDSVLVGSVYHKRFLLDDIWSSATNDTSHALIEGIGSTRGFLELIFHPFEAGSILECFSHGTSTYQTVPICVNYTSVPVLLVQNEITIYPNPNWGNFVITLDRSIEENSQIAIFNMMGQKMFNGTLNSREERKSYNVDYPSGMYSFVISNSSGTWSQNFIIR